MISKILDKIFRANVSKQRLAIISTAPDGGEVVLALQADAVDCFCFGS